MILPYHSRGWRCPHKCSCRTWQTCFSEGGDFLPHQDQVPSPQGHGPRIRDRRVRGKAVSQESLPCLVSAVTSRLFLVID